jgi:cytochrome c oxidase assembly factor CtaG
VRFDDWRTDRHSEVTDTDKMILLSQDFFYWLVIRRIARAKLWKYLKRLPLGEKPWMLVMMLLVILTRSPEASAVNMTVKSASTSVLMTSLQTAVMPTAEIVSLMKGKKPISIPENEVITSEDTEDYLEEDSEEDYDTMLKKENATGECFCLSPRNFILNAVVFRRSHRESLRVHVR